MKANRMLQLGRLNRTPKLPHFVPVLAVLLLAVCDGCSRRDIPEGIVVLKDKGWAVEQTADMASASKEDCTDEDLSALVEHGQDLKNLQIDLSGSKITDAGLEKIAGLSNVSKLNVAETGITGAGVAHIAGWTSLESLDLMDTKVDDDALVHLSKLTNLNSLSLSGCPLTGTGLGHLKDLSKLEALRISRNGIDDAGLAHLPPLPTLQILRLNDTKVTDASVEHLKQFPALEELWLQDVESFTDDGVAQLENALENLSIER